MSVPQARTNDTSTPRDVAAHDQRISHGYVIHYPDHGHREDDPHYAAFEAYRRSHVKTARCAYAAEVDDDSECGGGLELHHAHLEQAMLNGVDFAHLHHVFPAILTPEDVDAWAQSPGNLVFLCAKHHRGRGAGVHVLSASDWEAQHFVAAGTITG